MLGQLVDDWVILCPTSFAALLPARPARSQRHPGPRGPPARPDDDQRPFPGAPRNPGRAGKERLGKTICRLSIAVRFQSSF